MKTSITSSLLTINVMYTKLDILRNGWDYPTHVITEVAYQIDLQTKDWTDEDFTKSFDSWAKMIETIAQQIAPIIVDESVADFDFVVNEFLKQYFPHKFMKVFQYNIPTTNNLYGGFDDGVVEALNIIEAKEKAIKQINDGFDKINHVLKCNNLPCINYSTKELEIKEIK